MRDIDHNVFAGEPRVEHDAAWAKLLERLLCSIIRKALV